MTPDLKVPYYANIPLSVYSNNNMCLEHVSELPKYEKKKSGVITRP